MAILTVIQNGKETKISFEGTPIVSELLEKAGIYAPHPCGKKGTCKKCKAQMTGNVSDNDNLTCQTRLLGDAEVILLGSDSIEQIQQGNKNSFEVISPLSAKYGAAIDIGTTTVVLNLCDLNTGAVLTNCAKLNSQTAIAADVMGRIDAALKGKLSILREQILSDINELMISACKKTKIEYADVDSMVITGNTTMLYLLLGKNPQSLATAPFEADELFGFETEILGKKTYLPPCMNAFVGADITCAVLSSKMTESDHTSMLCDLGTNGELAMWKDKKLFVTSTAAGPAFEGVGISCGCQSIEGAIDKVALDGTEIQVHTINDAPAKGICGSGLIDAVAVFLETEAIDETGAVDDDLILTDNIELTDKDIRVFQLAKAAVAAGMQTLIQKSGITPDDINKLYIAGGFGAHLNIESAVKTGLILSEFKNKEIVLGNASLTGATELIFDTNKIDLLKTLAENSQHISIGGDPLFNENYIEQMMF